MRAIALAVALLAIACASPTPEAARVPLLECSRRYASRVCAPDDLICRAEKVRDCMVALGWDRVDGVWTKVRQTPGERDREIEEANK